MYYDVSTQIETFHFYFNSQVTILIFSPNLSVHNFAIVLSLK